MWQCRNQAHENDLPRGFVSMGVGIGFGFGIEITIGGHSVIDTNADSDPGIRRYPLYFLDRN
jgi:hypothetical protein